MKISLPLFFSMKRASSWVCLALFDFIALLLSSPSSFPVSAAMAENSFAANLQSLDIVKAEMSCCFGNSRNPRGKGPVHVVGVADIEGGSLRKVRNFSCNELRAATDNFSKNNKIGRGGFGVVYKGILKDGTKVAIKTLSTESKQGVREFLTEIDTISNVKHQNLVELIGCCVEESNRILVYEYVENNSLDRALLGYTSDRSKLDWGKRCAICLGTASGLVFLHEELVPQIVHRDIKASNVLLDEDFLPKIGDFGLAKLFPDNITHISTKIAGTTGYLAPEYAMGGHLTKMADVYSYGVLILEIISGRSSSKSECGGSDKLLLDWAWELYQEGRLLELVDTEMTEYPEEQVIRYIKVAFFCTQSSANKRPSMSQVVDMLTKNTRLNERQLTAPGFFPISAGNSNRTMGLASQQYSSGPVTVTELSPR